MAPRPDHSAKLKSRKVLVETVVKCSLRKLLLGEKKAKDNFIREVETRVIACSKRTHNASIALNLLFRELFHNVDDLKSVDIPDFLNVTFIRHLLLGPENTILRFPHIVDLFAKYPELHLDIARSTSDSNVYNFAAKKYIVNLKNHLTTNFLKVLKKYLYNYCDLTKEEAVDALFRITKWKREQRSEPTPVTINVVNTIRDILNVGDEQVLDDKWFGIEANLKHVLRLFVFVNRAVESQNGKLFKILPISRVKSNFITFDTFPMKGLLVDTSVLKRVGASSGLDIELWNSVLNTSKVAGKDKTFTGTIDTDGLVVNIHFRQPKVVPVEVTVQPSLEGKRVIGVDPGRTNIFFMTEELPSGRFKSYSLSRNQYYSEAGIFRAKQKTANWHKNIKDELEAMSCASPKSASLESFKTYFATVQSVKEALWTEHLKRRWKEQRFRLYGGKKRVFANFINKVNPDKDTVFAYGSAKFASGGKGEMSVPTSRAYKECKSRVQIVLIDEFRTSKVHWKDDSILKTVMKKNGDGKLVAVRGLLWCDSTNGTNKYVNRDLNAAINILRCATLPSRPTILSRAPGQDKITQEVGAILKC